MNKQQLIRIIKTKPTKIGKLLGFTKLTELHDEWLIDMLFQKEDETLMAHRGSYKTTCISISLALLLILRPNIKILFLRKTDSDVKEIVAQVKKILLTPYFSVFATILYGVKLNLITDNANEITTNLTTDPRGTAQLVSQGIGGALTGKHFDLIFTDDIININDRISKAERDRTKLIVQELKNILNRGGRFFNTGTPWHKDDAFTLMNKNLKKCSCYESGLLNKEEIKELKDSMSPSLFSANYELKHIASEDVLFDGPQYTNETHNLLNGESHIDAAYGSEDFSAFTIFNKVGDTIYILGKLWNKHIDNCIPEILELKKKYLIGKTYCETNGDKGYLKKRLEDFGEKNVRTYFEKTNKYIKISTELYRDWKKIVFVKGTDEEYINQICDYNENAKHDDAPDSLACSCRLLHKAKVQVIF